MIADFKITRYSHKTHIDRDRGVCEVDCSGFLVVLLRKKHRQNICGKLPHTISGLCRGFLFRLYYQKRRKAHWLETHQASARRRTRRRDCLAQAGGSPAIIRVTSCWSNKSPLPRGRINFASASRFDGPWSQRGYSSRRGIGNRRGTLWLDVDGDGRPIGYRWKSRRGMLHQVPVAIGRERLANPAFPLNNGEAEVVEICAVSVNATTMRFGKWPGKE